MPAQQCFLGEIRLHVSGKKPTTRGSEMLLKKVTGCQSLTPHIEERCFESEISIPPERSGSWAKLWQSAYSCGASAVYFNTQGEAGRLWTPKIV